MATLRTVTVDTDGVSATYSSLSNAEGTEQGDISVGTGTDEYVVFECEATTGVDDTTACVFNGWTTAVANYIEVQTPAANRHDGIFDDSLYCFAQRITMWEDYSRFKYLQFKGNSADALYFRSASAGAVYVSHCIFFGNAGSMASGIRNWQQTNTHYYWNNLIYESGSSGNSGGIDWEATGTCYAEHNTIVDMNDGECFGNTESSGVIVISNICQNPGTGDSCFSGTYDTGSDYNIASDTSDPASGANNQTSVTLTFNDATNDDYSLDSTDSEAIDNGPSSGYNTPVGTDGNDLKEVSRDANYDSGALEYVSVSDFSVNVNEQPTGTDAITSAMGDFEVSVADCPKPIDKLMREFLWESSKLLRRVLYTAFSEFKLRTQRLARSLEILDGVRIESPTLAFSTI